MLPQEDIRLDWGCRQACSTHFMALLSNPDALEREEDIGEVAVLSVVRDFPSRRNCAALAWRTLAAALDGRDNMVLGS